MYSMPYYTYGSTANFLLLGPTALIYIYIYIKNGAGSTANFLLLGPTALIYIYIYIYIYI